MSYELRQGDRVVVTDHSEEHFGEHGTVTRGEYRGLLTGRLMVDVRIDDTPDEFETGYYLGQVEPVRRLKAVA